MIIYSANQNKFSLNKNREMLNNINLAEIKLFRIRLDDRTFHFSAPALEFISILYVKSF